MRQAGSSIPREEEARRKRRRALSELWLSSYFKDLTDDNDALRKENDELREKLRSVRASQPPEATDQPIHFPVIRHDAENGEMAGFLLFGRELHGRARVRRRSGENIELPTAEKLGDAWKELPDNLKDLFSSRAVSMQTATESVRPHDETATESLRRHDGAAPAQVASKRDTRSIAMCASSDSDPDSGASSDSDSDSKK